MYFECVKLTMNIDDKLLSRVMNATGAKTKTEAIHNALSEIDRKNKLVALLSDDFGMTSANWKNAFDESSIIESDAADEPVARVAEKPVSYRERKPRPRR
jgi:hypothetical protein